MKLTRSRDQRMLTGVCGGLAKHLHSDPTLVRLVFVLLALFTGVGLFIYLAMAVLIPEEGKEKSYAEELIAHFNKPTPPPA